MEDIYSKFTELYAIHDWYFCEQKNDKQEMMREMVNNIISLLDALPEEEIMERSAELSGISLETLCA